MRCLSLLVLFFATDVFACGWRSCCVPVCRPCVPVCAPYTVVETKSLEATKISTTPRDPVPFKPIPPEEPKPFKPVPLDDDSFKPVPLDESMVKPAIVETKKDDGFRLRLLVPVEAEVVINDHVMIATGGKREFFAQNLSQDLSYTYVITVKNSNRQYTKKIKGHCGEYLAVDFTSKLATINPVR